MDELHLNCMLNIYTYTQKTILSGDVWFYF